MPSTAKNATKAWGVYAYIAGDNNLSDNGLVDIREMCEGGASKDLHVSVQIDTVGDQDGSVRYEITEPDFEGRCHRTVIQRLPEQDTGDPRNLASYLAWASQRYPARRRLFVVWNHGAGFMHEPTKDIGYDDSSGGDALTMAELRWALEKAGYGGKERLAILGFDACLMSMLEVAYEFAGVADFIVGSQQTEPGDGWPYRQVVAAGAIRTRGSWRWPSRRPTRSPIAMPGCGTSPNRPWRWPGSRRWPRPPWARRCWRASPRGGPSPVLRGSPSGSPSSAPTT